MRAAKVQASLRIRAVSPEPPLLAHRSSESRGTLRQKARSLAPLNGWACAVKICHDGMLEDTNSLGGAQLIVNFNDPYKIDPRRQFIHSFVSRFITALNTVVLSGTIISTQDYGSRFPLQTLMEIYCNFE